MKLKIEIDLDAINFSSEYLADIFNDINASIDTGYINLHDSEYGEYSSYNNNEHAVFVAIEE